MKGLKTILGIALATASLGGAVAFGVTRTTEGNKTEKAEAAVTSGKYRFNILAETNSYWSNDNIWTAIQLNSNECVFAGADADLGTTVANKSNWRQITLNNTTFYLQTIELPSDYSTTYWAPEFQRCNSSSGGGWWDKCVAPLAENWATKDKNTVRISGTNSVSDYGRYYKVALHTGLDHSNVSYSLAYGFNYLPGNPAAIFGYNFAGWYTDEDCEKAYSQGDLTGDINLYAKYSLKNEAHIAGTFNSWNANDNNYVMSIAENNQYTINVELDADDEFKVVLGSNWYGWDQVDSGSSVYNKYLIQGSNPDNTGYRIKVKTSGKYEIYLKTTWENNMIWIQQDSESEATTWAQSFLDATNSICSAGGTSANHLTALQGIWATQKSNFEALTSGARGKIALGTENATIKDAHDRYVHIMQRYGGAGGLDPFVDGPAYSSRITMPIVLNDNSVIILAVVVSIVAISTVGAFFLIKKRKHQ